MSDLARAWLVATLWATVALLRAVELDRPASVIFCVIGVVIGVLMVAATWRRGQ